MIYKFICVHISVCKYIHIDFLLKSWGVFQATFHFKVLFKTGFYRDSSIGISSRIKIGLIQVMLTWIFELKKISFSKCILLFVWLFSFFFFRFVWSNPNTIFKFYMCILPYNCMWLGIQDTHLLTVNRENRYNNTTTTRKAKPNSKSPVISQPHVPPPHG